jgi:hypothetical protein
MDAFLAPFIIHSLNTHLPQVTKINDLVSKNDFSQQNLINVIYHLQNSLETQRRASGKVSMAFGISLIVDQILSYLSFMDLVRFFQVCKTTRQWKGSKLTMMVHGLLRRYVSNPAELLDRMRQIGSIISGSTALWLVDVLSSLWQPGDLDIYVPQGMARYIVDFLHEEGYTSNVEHDFFQNRYLRFSGLKTVTKLRKGETTIDVLESSTPSAIQPITTFHVTAVMNYITPDSIVMFYPQLTFSRYAARHYATRRIDGPSWEPKYENRLYFVRGRERIPTSLQHTLCSALVRRPGDRYCLSLSFHDQLPTPSPMDSPAWQFESVDVHHRKCTQELCQVEHYYRHPADNVGIEVVADNTINLYV